MRGIMQRQLIITSYFNVKTLCNLQTERLSYLTWIGVDLRYE